MEKLSNDLRIGVLDSGVGGLTVVRELERLMPCESIFYYGDSANCPYGNRQKEEILELTLVMLDFLRKKGVKIVAIACNTISAIIDMYREAYDFPIVSIVEAASEYTASLELDEVGILATGFTINERIYETLIHSLRPNTRVYGQASRILAELVDAGRYDSPETRAEVNALLRALLKTQPDLRNIVLGCTHYTIVREQFLSAAPGITFIDPAPEQAKAVGAILERQGLLTGERKASLDIFTSGSEALYSSMLKKLEINIPASVHRV